MARWHIGDLYRVTATFKDAADVPTNPTTVALTLQKPDGTVSTPTPVNDGVGLYHYDIPLDQPGPWQYAYIGTGAVETAEPGEFYVTRSEVLA